MCVRDSDEHALSAGPNADRSRNREAGHMSFFFRLAAPEAVLAVIAGKALALVVDRTGTTQQSSLGFAADSSLRALGLRWEEEMGATLAHGVIHPIRRGGHFQDQRFES